MAQVVSLACAHHVSCVTLMRSCVCSDSRQLLNFPLLAVHLLSYHPGHQLHLPWCGGQVPCALQLMRTLAPLPSTTSHSSIHVEWILVLVTSRATLIETPTDVDVACASCVLGDVMAWLSHSLFTTCSLASVLVSHSVKSRKNKPRKTKTNLEKQKQLEKTKTTRNKPNLRKRKKRQNKTHLMEKKNYGNKLFMCFCITWTRSNGSDRFWPAFFPLLAPTASGPIFALQNGPKRWPLLARSRSYRFWPRPLLAQTAFGRAQRVYSS